MLTIVNKTGEDKWGELLNEFGEATIYHTPGWRRFLENTFDYKPYCIFAEDENGKLAGMLPLFEIRSKLTGKRLCAAPFSHTCGPIGDKGAKEELINAALEYHGKLDVKWLEVRDSVGSSSFENRNLYSTYILNLSTNVDAVWNNLKRDVTRGIRKSENRGVSVEFRNTMEDLRIFYELNCLTKKELGVPCHPWRFFRNLFTFLDGNISIYTAIKGNEEIAGGIMIYFKDTVLYTYGAANPSGLDTHPYHAFIWRSIQDACRNGYKSYDFGRCSYDNTGLIDFKKRWGTFEKKLYYSKFPRYDSSISENRTGVRYSIAQSAIHSMPMLLYEKFSDQVFGCFG